MGIIGILYPYLSIILRYLTIKYGFAIIFLIIEVKFTLQNSNYISSKKIGRKK